MYDQGFHEFDQEQVTSIPARGSWLVECTPRCLAGIPEGQYSGDCVPDGARVYARILETITFYSDIEGSYLKKNGSEFEANIARGLLVMNEDVEGL